MTLDQPTIQALCQKAVQAREKAYAPYSQFTVGAALLTDQGKIFGACNVENGVLGLSICAERNAVTRAIYEGEQSFKAIAIAASPIASPCGSCRQFLAEFCEELIVIVLDPQHPGSLKTMNLSQLLPDKFRFPGKN